MPLTPIPSQRAPLSGRTAARPGRRRAWWAGGSLLLHAAAIAVLLQVRRPEPDMPMTPSYDLLFDNGGSATPPTAEQAADDAAPRALPADPAPVAEAAAPEPAPTPTEPPQQQAMARPDPPPESPPEPAPEPPQPAQLAMAQPDAAVPASPPDAPPQPAEPAQPLPQATVPAPAPPAVRLAQPDALPPPVTPQDLVPGFTPPVPPPPLPPLVPPRPRPAPRPAIGSLGAPMDLNFGQASSRAPAPRGGAASRAIDFSLGAPKPGPNKSEAFFDIRAANIGADWAQGLAAYWQKHRFYPRQAVENGEDGTVQIVLVVNRLGRVESVEIKSRSGSPWLDMAALSTWRNAQLAPLPAENTDRTITIPLTISYLLIR